MGSSCFSRIIIDVFVLTHLNPPNQQTVKTSAVTEVFTLPETNKLMKCIWLAASGCYFTASAFLFIIFV